MPVFKDSLISKASIDVDFKNKPVGTVHAFDHVNRLINRICSAFDAADFASSVNDIYKLYKDINPQESVIKLLEDFANAPLNFTLPSATLIDGPAAATGILTSNGLRKPLYFFYRLMSFIPLDVIAYDSNYLTFKSSGENAILLYNPSQTKNATIDIAARNLASNCKLVRYRLAADSSCLSYLTQLNFASALDADDYENINAMSQPKVDFEIIPDVKQYYTSVELAPFDVLLLHFKQL